MHEWHQHEHASGLAHGVMNAEGNRFLCQHQCHLVLREGFRRAAVELAGELVEHDDLGQPAARLGPPPPRLAAGDGRVRFGEPGSEGGVEFVRAGEPVVRSVLHEPEIEHVLKAAHLSS